MKYNPRRIGTIMLASVVIAFVLSAIILLIGCQPKTVVVYKDVTPVVPTRLPLARSGSVRAGELPNSIEWFYDTDRHVICYTRSSLGMGCAWLPPEDRP